MPANSEEYPWPSHYGHFNFFEKRMNDHGQIASISSEGNGVYLLKRPNDKELKVFICECYSFGLAEYLEVLKKVTGLDVLVINSVWCGYTSEAKRQAINDRKGLFKISEFMGALNRQDYWNYVPAEN